MVQTGNYCLLGQEDSKRKGHLCTSRTLQKPDGPKADAIRQFKDRAQEVWSTPVTNMPE